MVREAVQAARDGGHVRTGDLVVVLAGIEGRSSSINVLRVIRVTQRHRIVRPKGRRPGHRGILTDGITWAESLAASGPGSGVEGEGILDGRDVPTQSKETRWLTQ